jgi:ribose 5-phosphate isomerase B
MKKLILESDIIKIIKDGKQELVVNKDTILTPLAIDKINSAKIKLVSADMVKERNTGISSTGKIFQKIVIGSDHTGFGVKKIISKMLQESGYQVIDVGTYTEESCDYPDFAFIASAKIITKEACAGILIDATGIPSAIAANKFPGIRAATCYNEFSARSSREHNNANILVVGALSLGLETIKSITTTWLSTEFLKGRHQRRLDKITDVEKKLLK